MLGHETRFHRPRAPGIARTGGSTWFAPRRASWWIGVLFAIGSVCFVLGPMPGFVQLVGSAADGTVFFVGSVFFTSAALLQYLEAANADRGPAEGKRRRMRLLTFEPHGTDWWATLIQLVGTLYFNVDTFRAMQASFDTSQVDRLVWRPELFGSICFLISGAARLPRGPRRRRPAGRTQHRVEDRHGQPRRLHPVHGLGDRRLRRPVDRRRARPRGRQPEHGARSPLLPDRGGAAAARVGR